MRTAWNKGITKYQPKPCLCGCGELVSVHKYSQPQKKGFTYQINDFIKAHGKRGVGGFDPEIHTPRFCACGCGDMTNLFRGNSNRFIKGHENIGRNPWNKGGTFSEATRAKMSLARRGKEPANKIFIDRTKLHQLYVVDQKTAKEIAASLEIPYNAVKNRLRSLSMSRSLREASALPSFRDKMRVLRIEALTSKKTIATPNKLEKLVYDSLDSFSVSYQRQVALFNKFVVDAFFPQRKLVLEVFGRYWHENPKIMKKDHSKKQYLLKCGYPVEEIWDYEIKQQGVDVVLRRVLEKYSLI
jgi:very-short-patch-repair endonuclease